MHNFTPEGRWTAPAGQFAARIRAGDLPGVLSKNLLVDFGARAVLVEEGEILGELRPGTHTIDSLAQRFSFEPRRQTAVVLIREEEIPIELAETVLCTRDGQTVQVGLCIRVQADNVVSFLENVLGAREFLAIDELRALLTPVLTEQLREAVGRMALDDLMQADARHRVATELGDGGETLQHCGFRLGPALTISVRPKEHSREPAVAPDASNAGQPPVEPPSRLTRSGRRTICGPGKGADARTRGTSPSCPKPEGTLETCPTTKIVVKSLGMRLASIPPGSFMMGSPPDEPERSGTEDQHLVEITQPFCLSIFPVTQEEYRSVMGTDPSCFAEATGSGVSFHVGDRKDAVTGAVAADMEKDSRPLPVERANWDDACEFCRRLSELPAEKAAGRLYRLPTEAEWEYACRAGTASAYAFGPSLTPAEANFDGRGARGSGVFFHVGDQRYATTEAVAADMEKDSRPLPVDTPAFVGATTPVGSFRPNAWGLCDMHGNLGEWCADWFSPDYYRQSPPRDPLGPAAGFARVLRGGSWRSRAGQCRSAARWSATPTQRHDAFGFRVVCVSR